jgi:phosphoenolpyruvate carboxylase
MYTLPKTARFNQNVLSKYQIYNSVFMKLHFDSIDDLQYALSLINKLKEQENSNTVLIQVYEKLVTRSLFGNTNASRNSA